MKSANCYLKVHILLSVFLLCPVAEAGEWPTYRHDNARTGCTSAKLVLPLDLRWIHVPVHPPQPAWSAPAERPREGFLLRHRVSFDDAFQVAAAGDHVYFGSSADDKVYALDAATGEQIWSFCTGGPVRLAPTVWKDRLFVGSDDGFAYCLKADDGELLWKKRGGPKDERLLGNGRMISRWPVRTGVLLDDGGTPPRGKPVVYFGAGIFPHENVYLLAVGADDGKPIWRNDRISQGAAYRDDLSPQGYLLASATHLFAPSGRALPVALDKASGQLIFNPKYGWRGEQAGGAIGGTYALLADNQIYTGTQNHLLALDQSTGKTGFAWFPGRRLTVEENMAYMATGRELLAMDRRKYAEASRRQNSLEYRIKALRSDVRRAKGERLANLKRELAAAESQLTHHRRDNVAPAIKWRVPTHCDAELIVTKDVVLAGGQDEVCAFSRADGNSLWSEKVDGKASGLAVANGRLYVSTDKGNIYCFVSKGQAGEEAGFAKHIPHRLAEPYPADGLTTIYKAAAEAIIMETGVTKGYCLVVGAEKGRLAWELARRTDLQVIGIEPDPEKVIAARSALDAAGMYGHRVTIDRGELSSLPYSNYFANLIVSDSLLVTGKIPGEPDKLARHLKPCGGTICLGVPASSGHSPASPGRRPANLPEQTNAPSSSELTRWLEGLGLGHCQISQINGLWAILKRGPLPGAGKWTHQYAEPGNTACSDDKLVGGPLGLLWFGEPGSAPMVNRHDAAAAPLAVNGRMFVQGENVVMTYDSYNGTLLWKRDIPGAMRTRLKRYECGNLAACEDSFFIAVNDTCLRLDAETGQTLATYSMPSASDSTASAWGYLAYVDGILHGSTMTERGISDSVFAIDSTDGELLWNYNGTNIVNLTIAIGDGWVFFVDSSLTPEQRRELLGQDKKHLASLKDKDAKKAEAALKKLDVRMATALDAKTGAKVWQTPVDVTDCSNIGIGGGELTAMYHNGILVLCGANANGHYWSQFLSGEFSRRRLVALCANTGDQLWARDANYRHRPLIIGDTVLAEPWAFDIRTGEQQMRRHPLTDAKTPWQFLRPGHHCGAISACPGTLLMRSGSTAYYDLRDDSGIRHFAGHRLGCWINGIPADGLALMPEASAGCICLFPIVCSVALEPRPDYQRWTIYSADGSNTPVRSLAVNLGAPGDRRDDEGRMWFGYPRPALPSNRAAMGFDLDVQTEFFEGGGYLRRSSESEPVSATDQSWAFTSCGRGLKRCTLALRDEKHGPAEYTVRLHFAELEDEQPGQRIFNVTLQGEKALEDFDVAKEAGGVRRAVSREFTGVGVERDLEIELTPNDEAATSADHAPILCAVEVVLEAK